MTKKLQKCNFLYRLKLYSGTFLYYLSLAVKESNTVSKVNLKEKDLKPEIIIEA